MSTFLIFCAVLCVAGGGVHLAVALVFFKEGKTASGVISWLLSLGALVCAAAVASKVFS